jgi:hypothetical protein
MTERILDRQLQAVFLVLICSIAVLAQTSEKPYSEWSKKEARKVLDDSPWVKKVRLEGGVRPPKLKDNSKVALPPSTNGNPYDPHRYPDPRVEQAAKVDQPKTAAGATCRVRLLSALPIREAFGRSGVIADRGENIAAYLRALTEADLENEIIVAISCDFWGPIEFWPSLPPPPPVGGGSARNPAGSTEIYLQTTEDRRVHPERYEPPRDDRLGAIFVFPRLVDGEPLVTPGSRELRFCMKSSKSFSIDVRFKLKAMVYAGKLEY